jgi:hypothetical protein
MEAEAGGFVLLTHVPPAGARAQRARDLLTGYREQPGTEQNDGVLKDPVLVKSLFLKKPERIAAWGWVLLLALRLWRLMERAMRRHVDPTRTALPGWDKPVTERPPALMLVTTFAGVIVLQGGHDRPRARPLSAVQHHYLAALEVPATGCTRPAGSQRTPMAARRLSRRHKPILPWLAVDHQRTRGLIRSRHQNLVRALAGDQGNSSHRLQTLATRGLIVLSRSPGGKAEAGWLTSEGQQWAS